MENNPHPGPNPEKSWLRIVFLGLVPAGLGILDLLIALNLIEYRDPRPERVAIFNDPHSWEVFAIGAMFLFFGIANLLPARLKLLGRLNVYLLLISFLAVVLGVILKKLG